MQLNHLKVENFRLFEQAEFSFDPRFNLVIGENGRGKTSLLRAIAVTLGGWALSYVDDLSGRRPIQESEAHVIYRDKRLLRARHVSIHARFSADVIGGDGVLQSGSVVDFEFHGSSGGLTGGLAAKVMLSGSEVGSDFLAMDQRALVVEGARNNRDFNLPVIAFYECDRLWSSGEALSQEKSIQHPPDRFSPYTDWQRSSVNDQAIGQWLIRHQLASLQQGKVTPGFKLLQAAARGAIENCSGLYFDIEGSKVIVEFSDGRSTLFENLSDGQRTLLGLFCDLARRISILNPHLGERALAETPGVVLIDELDLHLHPKWQRHIIQDLRRTFPKVQFICTTHSPQLIGQARPEEIIQLDGSRAAVNPAQSLGMDSNWILRHIMGSDDRDPDVAKALDELFEHIEQARFDEAQAALVALRQRIGEHPELVEADALIGRYTRHDGE